MLKRLPVVLSFTLLVALSGYGLYQCAGASYVGYRIKPNYPKLKPKTLDIPGLEDEVEIWLTEHGVPHVSAKSERDLLRAVGFLHGRDRFFQMDVLRRYARGRLSEMVGEQPLGAGTTVDLDLAMRAWGMERLSREDVKHVPPELKPLLDAYVEGVNTALTQLKKPLEYRLLRMEPDPWTLADTFALGRLTAWSITHNWGQELSRLLLALHGGADRALEIYPSESWPGSASLELDGPEHPLPPAMAEELRGLFPPKPPPAAPSVLAENYIIDLSRPGTSASNGWVLTGERTASNKPVVAADPHLSHILPSFFYQQHLTCPGLDVIGVTVPGLPYVLVGHNGKVAWALTSAVGDVLDLYIERPDPKNSWQLVGHEAPLKADKVTIRIRKRKRKILEREFTLRRTKNGPLLNDMYPGLLPAWAPLVSLRYVERPATEGICGFRRVNMAGNFDELADAAQSVPTPVNHVLAGDVYGTIGIVTTGRIPDRRHHQGTFPAPGWVKKYQWEDMIPVEKMPRTKATKGLFANTNNRIWDPKKSQVLFGIDSGPSYRFDRVLELLKGQKAYDVKNALHDQLDVKSLRARRVAPKMLEALAGLTSPTPLEEQALEALKAWDFETGTHSPAASLFFKTYRLAAMRALADELDGRGLRFVMSERYIYNAIDRWYDREDHPVWDDRTTPAVETRSQVVQAAFREAVTGLATVFGVDPAEWGWGRLHVRHFKHLFGGRKILKGLVNLPRDESPGAVDTVWKAHFNIGNPAAPFRVMGGPSLRMAVDLGDLTTARWVIETGASGWPGAPHYGDQYELWKQGKTLPMRFDWPTIKTQSKTLLVLQPGSDPVK